MAPLARFGWLLGGWLLGVMTAIGLGVLVASSLSARGLVVPVAVGQVSDGVQGEVEAAMLAELPRAVQALKQAVPAQVALEIRRRLESGSFRLGEVPLTVPPELLGSNFDDQVQATVSSALDQLAAGNDASAAAHAVAGQVGELLRHRLTAAVTDWHFTLHPWRYLSVPVTLQPQP